MGLSIERLTVRLGQRTVLHDVAAELLPGRVTALLGPNGAGKSSLLRAMLALIPVESGRVLLDGSDMAALDARTRARRLGYLPQSAELAWNIPARSLVELGRAPHRSPFAGLGEADRAAIGRAMALTDTVRFAERLTHELSGGERARVLLARVLAGEPDWLLADEPLASLDPAHQLDMLGRLHGYAAEGHGVVVVLHDLSHAARIADDVMLLSEGRLVAFGAAEEVLRPELLEQVYGIGFERIGVHLIPTPPARVPHSPAGR
ncbi:ATP-binding cassette domain-containing protein [Sphingomonas sp. MAH-20]|uniref:ATP-binding cassette domain-containing protein n=1 Tax=Sphingomonas horti TaxID=2682842 RepID=A0A6I4IWS1_9SPHN|nr:MULTISPECIES: ABC transporter ATP-binding protein [Sphingomonas]MBA2920270.1 ABC transporter ATP-binding protein [Sphingomonas sp. CGMCC 1.13658]MVO76524.1 ATP-binding cassette domain-containing protein [Sphingomonas horti]